MKKLAALAAIALIGCDPTGGMMEGFPAEEVPEHVDDMGVDEGEPEPEPPLVIVEGLVVEIGAGPCGNGIVNDGETCDCGSDGVFADFCLTQNGPDAWCSDECQIQCTGWSGFVAGTNMCDPPPTMVEECNDEAFCRNRLEQVEANRLHAQCVERDDEECDWQLNARLEFIASWLQAGLDHCAFPGRDPRYFPECH